MSDHHERRQYNLEMAQTIGRIESKLDSLCGPEGRVTKLENAQTRQWWYSVGIAPLLMVLQQLLRKVGANV